MLSLLEVADSDKGGSGDKDGLDQYAEFIQQQPDIIAATGGGNSDINHDDRTFILRCRLQGKLAETASAREDSSTVVIPQKTPACSTLLPNDGDFTVPSRNSRVASLLSSKSGIPPSDFEKALDGEDMSNEAVDIEPLSYVPARVTRELQEVGGGKVCERNACDRSVVETSVASTGMVPLMVAPETDMDNNLAQALQGNAPMSTQESIVAENVPLGGKRGTGSDDRIQNDSRHPQVQTPEDIGEDFNADLPVTKSAAEEKAPDSVLCPERATAREGGVSVDETGAESKDNRNLGEVTAPNIDNHVSLSGGVVIVSHTKDDTGPVSAGEELHPGAGVSSQTVEHVVDPLAGKGTTNGGKCGTTNQAGCREVTTELAWIEGYDSTHDCYYYHHVSTGESTWNKPNEPFEPYVHPEEHDGDHALAPRSKNDRISESRAKPKAKGNERHVKRRSRNGEKSAAAAAMPRKKDGKGREESHHGHRHKRGEEGRTSTASKTRPSSFHRKMPTRRASSRKKCVSSSSISLSDPEDRDHSHGGGSRGVQGQRRGSQSNLSTSRSDAGAVIDRDRDRSRQSRRRGVKSALERLNDLTDENKDMFGRLSTSSEERRMLG